MITKVINRSLLEYEMDEDKNFFVKLTIIEKDIFSSQISR